MFGQLQVCRHQTFELVDGVGMALAVADREVQHRVGHVDEDLCHRGALGGLGPRGERCQHLGDLLGKGALVDRCGGAGGGVACMASHTARRDRSEIHSWAM